MATIIKDRPFTPEEYLERERLAETRSEYLDGRIYAMSGASIAHNQITLNVASSLLGQVKRGPCRVYSNDMRVQIGVGRQFVYPDVVVVCGNRQVRDSVMDTLLNPTVVIEVLSPSTERFDKGWKAEAYRSLPSLQEYILIAQDRVHVERYLRDGESWTFDEFSSIDAVLQLPSVDCVVALRDVYDLVVEGDEAE